MTPEEKTKYKEEVAVAMYEYLKTNNLMDATNRQIMSQMPNIYRHLEEKKLVKFGLTYQYFLSIANDQFMMALMRGIE